MDLSLFFDGIRLCFEGTENHIEVGNEANNKVCHALDLVHCHWICRIDIIPPGNNGTENNGKILLGHLILGNVQRHAIKKIHDLVQATTIKCRHCINNPLHSHRVHGYTKHKDRERDREREREKKKVSFLRWIWGRFMLHIACHNIKVGHFYGIRT